ncbi:MAG: hypothetical protein KGJ58_01665 [Patescibacteria group bacterium]|nr:hypothetical protein [Patescibacteria group bacterium]MDE1988644.1 hypothetical protein [Patescibacteria group bacterium]MDE2218146.1 hypothetical protein [Patescibacteria group bacterium]
MKTAQQVAEKFASRASAAAGDYVNGAMATTKDQAAAAIAAKEIYKQALTASFGRDSYAKGLQKSGKAGWQNGVKTKGSERFATGVSESATKYATNSGKYDSARAAASSLPRGLKGSETNLARVKAVVVALRTAKVGASA